MKAQQPTKTLIVGHRNPDTDSLAAAYALAALKRAKGYAHVEAICAGVPGERSEFIFNKFGAIMPRMTQDVYPRVRDICIADAPVINEEQTVLEAIYLLNQYRVSRLAVINKKQEFRGMFSLFHLIGGSFEKNPLNELIDVIDQKIFSSISLINKAIRGRILTPFNIDLMQEFYSYVATMRHESLLTGSISWDNPEGLVIIVGDRENVQRTAIEMQARLLIVTGGNKISKELLELAEENHVTVITTRLNSTSVLQNIKFSTPVSLLCEETDSFSPDERLCDIRPVVMSHPEDVLPVVEEGKYLGIFKKNDIDGVVPFNLILVDHNEFDQAIEGVEDVPIVEIVDHHRFGLPPTDHPIKINCDSVGSTCTLITEMYQQSHCSIPRDVAGVLLGGVITDTILLRSPTATPRDHKALLYLEEIVGIDSEAFAEEIYKIGSLIGKLTAPEVLKADKKIFTCGKITMGIAQVEEVGYVEFEHKKTQLIQSAQTLMKQEHCQFFALLVTNVTTQNSLLLAVGTSDLLRLLPFRKIEEHIYDLPGVLSRKKQLIPQLMKSFAILH